MFLRAIQFLENKGACRESYPFNIPAFCGVKTIPITRPVTFFIGENGSGKSTLLEAVAENRLIRKYRLELLFQCQRQD